MRTGKVYIMDLKYRILIAEDEERISRFIGRILHVNGYEILAAENARQTLSLLSSCSPDLVILDLGLPDMDGLEVLRTIREISLVPVVVVSARTMEQDKVEALDAGADDYITKPFGSNELLARIRTALRHGRMNTGNSHRNDLKSVRTGDLEIHFDSRIVTVGGLEVHLTQNEYKIVSILGKNIGKVMTYDSILHELWGVTVCSNNQALRVHMANIRRKIEKNPADPQYIQTEVGVGYRMIENT